jgi:hypothetical protein
VIEAALYPLRLPRLRLGREPRPPFDWDRIGVVLQALVEGFWMRGKVDPESARLGTLHELTKLGPVPIIADALGYHPSTIERHAIGSASTYAEYIAAARELRQTS